MRTSEVVREVKKYRDYYGFDITEASGLKTKLDCLQALQQHKRQLEDTLSDAFSDIDRFIAKLGIGDLDLLEAEK